MLRTILRKLLELVPVLFLVTIGTALLLELTPGDPVQLILGPEATQQQIELVRDRLGLNEPFLERYGDWVSSAAQGDFGTSLQNGRPVWDLIKERLPVTLEIAVLAQLIALVLAVPAGVYAAYRARGAFDRGTATISSILIASPIFVTALFLAYFFAVKWRIFPVSGWVPIEESLTENLRYAFLPSLALALGEIAVFMRIIRSDMITILDEEYVASASARGLSASYILFRHALKPASFSLLTLAALSLGRLLGGTVIVEQLFGLPGLGSLLINAILGKDLVVVQGVVLFIAVAYVLINTFVDIFYTFLDPRIRTAV